MYNKANPDAVHKWDEGVALLVDDERFTEKLSEGEALAPLYNYGEVLQYLEKARQAGFTEVLFARYSETASQIEGEICFMGDRLILEEMIATCRQKIGEGND